LPLLLSEELIEYAKKRAERFGGPQREEAPRSVTQVQASLVENVKSRAEASGLTWFCDGPRTRAGTNTAPGPLQYFLSSMAFCQLTHYAENAALMRISLDEVRMIVKGHFNSLPGNWFDTIEFETHIISKARPSEIRELSQRAEHECYVTNTLKRAAAVSGKVFLNEEPLPVVAGEVPARA
jgi:uncharacterized OsmC-like protein